eukprot:TRINITY_DN2867_c0_g1_i1.p1 TRINITY_DN2867_c0_g1~~TRINITY_DN2867_c0_g1_i1.p1  ORF type:complete len:1535 (+),score=370.61 TRINITY_DN2867_c0_g1_i1:90-4694(+)
MTFLPLTCCAVLLLLSPAGALDASKVFYRQHHEEECGVVQPMFKEKVEVKPVAKPAPPKNLNIVQQVGNTVGGVLQHLNLPFFGGGAGDDHPPAKNKTTENHTHDLQCLMPYLMNCSDWATLGRRSVCPTQCPFITQVRPFACTFACVNASQCSFANIDAPYANPLTLLCEPSQISGCQIAAENGTRCAQCRQRFSADEDGKYCTYDEEASFFYVLNQIHRVGIWGIIAVVLLLIGIIVRTRESLMKHWNLLTFARIHYHLCKVRKSPKIYPDAPLYSVFEDLHSKFVLGVGLPLYYNSLVFLFILCVIIFLATQIVLSGDESNIFSYASDVTSATKCASVTEAYDAKDTVSKTTRAFMRKLADTVLGLYIVVLISMLIHAGIQKRHAEWFESRHRTAKDLALKVSGLPPHATDEPQIMRCLSAQFGVEVTGVSIAYDMGGRWHEVQALIDRHLAYADAEARGGYPAGIGVSRIDGLTDYLATRNRSDTVDTNSSTASSDGWMRESKLDDRALVRAWFAGDTDKQMKGTGYAFVVFDDAESRDRALQTTRTRPLVWRDPNSSIDYALKAKTPKCEPTNINWHNLRLGVWAKRGRFLGALLGYLTIAALLAILIYYPYAVYVTSYLDQAGTLPQGFMMGCLGFLVGLTWWIMCMVIGNAVGYIGLHTAEDENVVVFILFTLFCVAATSFNVYLTWYFTSQVWNNPGSLWMQKFTGDLVEGPVNSLRDLRREIDLGFRIFQLLVPGVLFTPCLLCPLNNFIIPYFREGVLLAWQGHRKSGRDAERYLEPLPLGLAWDYQGHATVPFCCGLTFFVMSPWMWWTHAYLCLWVAFLYMFQRIMHLRVCKKMYFTSTKLDRVVLYVGWGLILAELAVCHAYWKIRLEEWTIKMIPISIVGSYAIYWLLLRGAVGVISPTRSDSSEDRQKTHRAGESPTDGAPAGETGRCYDWLNVNPAHVLKNQYCRDLLDHAAPVVFYDPGKEYLQLCAEGGGPICGPTSTRWNLMNRGMDVELEGLGIISSVKVPDDKFIDYSGTVYHNNDAQYKHQGQLYAQVPHNAPDAWQDISSGGGSTPSSYSVEPSPLRRPHASQTLGIGTTNEDMASPFLGDKQASGSGATKQGGAYEKRRLPIAATNRRQTEEAREQMETLKRRPEAPEQQRRSEAGSSKAVRFAAEPAVGGSATAAAAAPQAAVRSAGDAGGPELEMAREDSWADFQSASAGTSPAEAAAAASDGAAKKTEKCTPGLEEVFPASSGELPQQASVDVAAAKAPAAPSATAAEQSSSSSSSSAKKAKDEAEAKTKEEARKAEQTKVEAAKPDVAEADRAKGAEAVSAPNVGSASDSGKAAAPEPGKGDARRDDRPLQPSVDVAPRDADADESAVVKGGTGPSSSSRSGPPAAQATAGTAKTSGADDNAPAQRAAGSASHAATSSSAEAASLGEAASESKEASTAPAGAAAIKAGEGADAKKEQEGALGTASAATAAAGDSVGHVSEKQSAQAAAATTADAAGVDTAAKSVAAATAADSTTTPADAATASEPS